MEITIKQGDLLKQEVDAIVNPANATGYMGYGAAKAIVKAGGIEIEEEAVRQAPLIIGDAILTTAGKLPFKAIIHTATLDNTNEPLEQGNVSKALLGAALEADEAGFKTIAIPGMGTGIVGLPPDVVAQAMREALKDVKPMNLEKIILVDLNEDVVESWERYFRKTRE
jgi:O-acetyl-ADP-ribose deacetylase (regulator of RNase III)